MLYTEGNMRMEIQ